MTKKYYLLLFVLLFPMFVSAELNDLNLVDFFKLDNLTGVKGTTFLNESGTINFTAGIVGNGTNVSNTSATGVRDYFNSSTVRQGIYMNPYQNRTYNLWIKHNNVGGVFTAGTEFIFDTVSNKTRYRMYYDFVNATNTTVTFSRTKNAVSNALCRGNVSSDVLRNFTMLTSVYNGTHVIGYVNNVQLCTAATDQLAGNGADINCTTIGSAQNIDTGCQNTGVGYTQGIIDAIGIWNRTLDSSEISTLYNNGFGLEYPFSTSYQLNITSPTNGFPITITGGNALSINFTSNKDGVNATSADLNITNISVGGQTCPIISHFTSSTCTGTPAACSGYASSQTNCEAIGCGFTASSCSGTPAVCTSYSDDPACSDSGCSWTPASSVGTGLNFTSTNNVLNAAGWLNPNNANANDGSTATGNLNNRTRYGGFNFKIPSGVTIDNICVQFEAGASTNTGTNTVTVQAWNGSTWGSTNVSADIQTTIVNITMCGGLWGLTWTNTTANNVSFNFSATVSAAGRVINLDFIVANVSYTSAGTCGGSPSACNTFGTDPTCTASSCTWNSAVCSGTANNCVTWNSDQTTCELAVCSFTPDINLLEYACFSTYCQANCTSPTGLTGLKDLNVSANYTIDNSFLSDLEALSVNFGGGSDSCTYSGSGNWGIQCPDSCILTTNTDILRNNITFNGSGVIQLQANLTNWSIATIQNQCTVRTTKGGLRWK